MHQFTASQSFRRASTFLIAALSFFHAVPSSLLAESPTQSAEPAKGPRGGRLLVDGKLGVEVTIYERGVPPEFRVYLYADGKPLDPEAARLSIELHRLLGQVDAFRFTKKGDYLLGDLEVTEPHSFDVKVTADWNGKRSSWTYDSYEGRTTIAADAAKEAGIAIETAGPADINVTLPLQGRVIQDEEETAHVGARYPGVVRSVAARLGAKVKKGEILAVIESNASLSAYELRSPFAGTITRKDVSIGEFVSEKDTLFEISDLEKLLVEFHAGRDDLPRFAIGQPVSLVLAGEAEKHTTKVAYLSPTSTPESQSVAMRARVAPPTPKLVPGLFVEGDVLIEKAQVKVAVKKVALQTYRDWTVVFVQDGDRYEIRPLELGREDGEWVEVLSGLEAGQRYVTTNSFVVKADVGKNGATHDH
jgi:cobalt-zinc-cadmium efflux system membrane fusion protein